MEPPPARYRAALGALALASFWALSCAEDPPAAPSGDGGTGAEICDNGLDDDGDGTVDCADDSCGHHPACDEGLDEEVDCADGVDEDHDGLADCADPGCAASCSAPASELSCDDARDDDGDGLWDCADPDCRADPACCGAPVCGAVEACGNGADDDGDGWADCADPDCEGAPGCSAAEICDDGSDDDGDGLADCADPDCAADPACRPGVEDCANGVDDDRDGAADCFDVDCAVAAPCLPPVSPGDLVVSELMIDPSSGGGDPANEWFEVYNRTGSPIDLAGFGVSDLDGTPARVHVVERSVLVPAGGHAVLAHSADAALGFVPDYVYGATAISLANAGDQLRLTGPDGAVIDEVDWAVAGFPSTTAGVSLEASVLDAAGNDAPSAWCLSPAPAFNPTGERGTPKAAGSCGGGGARAPRAGELVITELLYDALGQEPDEEWFEVLSTAREAVDLGGMAIASGTAQAQVAGSLELLPGARAVFCRSASAGPPGCVAYGSVSLANAGDDLTLTAAGAVLDTVVYDTQAPWPVATPGTSIELSETHLDATGNNDGGRWCLARAPFGGGAATPGWPGGCP